jgi:hypothetical protein
VHRHLVANGKCKEVVEEIKMLIEEEANRTPNVKTLAISLSTKKYLLVKHLFNGSSETSFKFLKGEQLECIHDKFVELSFLNICNLVALFKHHMKGSYINNILELKSMRFYHYIYEC